jgi:tRNA G18 (ribose-2'-O)-methylase SpoU
LSESIALCEEPGVSLAGEELGAGSGSTEPQLHEKLRGSRVALVLGSEGHGVSRVVRENSLAVSIPMLSGSMESLCVSQAGAILLSVFGRSFPDLLAGVKKLLD